MLVVGVVAADLGAAGAAEQGSALGLRPIAGGESLRYAYAPPTGPVQLLRAAVQGVKGGQGRVIASVFQGMYQLGTGRHGANLIFVVAGRSGPAVR